MNYDCSSKIFPSLCWFEIPGHFPYVKLSTFVVMPDHVHRISIISKPDIMKDTMDTTNENVNVTIGGFAGNKNPMILAKSSRSNLLNEVNK